MEIDRRAFLATLGGAVAIETMSSDALADSLEHYMIAQLDQPKSNAERPYRRGVGSLFIVGSASDSAPSSAKLEPMPPRPTLLDLFKLRFAPANHVLQSATRAMKTGQSEETTFACLLHDLVLSLIKPDHGWWGAQLFEPYVSDRVSWAIRYHQSLRFYPDPSVGYEYPEMYHRLFGKDYVPPPHVEAAYKYARNHRWYMHARLITVNDLYSFDPNARVSIEPFVDIIGRHFKQPREGLGNDNSPSAHMWRTIGNPDLPL